MVNCDRCKGEDSTESWMYVKFHDTHYDVGQKCWDIIMSWVFVNNPRLKGRRLSNPQPNQQDICSLCGIEGYMPRHQFIEFGNQQGQRFYACEVCEGNFLGMYYRGPGSLEGGCEDYTR